MLFPTQTMILHLPIAESATAAVCPCKSPPKASPPNMILMSFHNFYGYC